MGTHELKGDRGYQEDRVIALTLRGGERFIGCYDGHCGELCAQYCKDHLHETLQAQPTFGDDATVGEAFRQTFQLVNTNFIAGDAESADPEHGGSGTTAVVVVQRGASLHYAHVGDSRAVRPPRTLSAPSAPPTPSAPSTPHAPHAAPHTLCRCSSRGGRRSHPSLVRRPRRSPSTTSPKTMRSRSVSPLRAASAAWSDVPASAAAQCRAPPAPRPPPPSASSGRLQAAQHSQGEGPPRHSGLPPRACACRAVRLCACRQGLFRPRDRTRPEELPRMRALHRRRPLQGEHAARRAPPLRPRARHTRRGVTRARAGRPLRRARERRGEPPTLQPRLQPLRWAPQPHALQAAPPPRAAGCTPTRCMLQPHALQPAPPLALARCGMCSPSRRRARS